MSKLTLDQGITAQRNKVACKQQGNHMVMQQCNKKERQTDTKVYNDGQRAHAAMTSRCGNRLTQTDRRTDKQTDKQIGR